MDKQTQHWSQEDIKQLLLASDTAIARALHQLTSRQTVDERRTEQTKHHNRRGYLPYHAKRMTSMTKQLERGHPLTQKQLDWLRQPKRLLKYSRQLAEAANERINTLELKIRHWERVLAETEYADDFASSGAQRTHASKQIALLTDQIRRTMPHTQLQGRRCASKPTSTGNQSTPSLTAQEQPRTT
jgi:hypothetical protein